MKKLIILMLMTLLVDKILYVCIGIPESMIESKHHLNLNFYKVFVKKKVWILI